VTAITVIFASFVHASLARSDAKGTVTHMDRRIDEEDYVLINLCRARQEVIACPEWFEPDALQRIEKALASIEQRRLAAKAA